MSYPSPSAADRHCRAWPIYLGKTGVEGFFLASGLVALDNAGSSLHAHGEGSGDFMPDDRLTPAPDSARPPEEGISSQPLASGRPASDDDWIVQWGGKEVGPFTAEEMRANAAGGTLAPDDLVRQRGITKR